MARWNRPSKTLRDDYMAVQRRMTDLRVRLSDPVGTTYPDDGLSRATPDGGKAALDRLARLEAGEPAIVNGSQVGLGDHNSYVLEGDGRLVPVEAVRDPDYPAVKTVRNWRRPDGSLVWPG